MSRFRCKEFLKEYDYVDDIIMCHQCHKKIKDDNDLATYYGYWSATPLPVHKECLKKKQEENAYECQKLDADCNDCGYFERGKFLKGDEYEKERDIFPAIEGWKGRCKLKDKIVFGHGNYCSGHKCFVHRKDIAHSTP